jgi:hypothetical protein
MISERRLTIATSCSVHRAECPTLETLGLSIGGGAPEAAFASKFAPPLIGGEPVGASLLAMGPEQTAQIAPSLASIFTIAAIAFRLNAVSVGSIPCQHETPNRRGPHADPSADLSDPDGVHIECVCLVRPERGANIMIHTVTLAVRFPVFGNNFYAQEFESRKELTLMFDKNFEALLIPAADRHFSNEVVGLNDQFRFLNDVLVEHLLDVELAKDMARSFGF